MLPGMTFVLSPPSFHGCLQDWWLLCAVVSSVVRVGESGVDLFYRV